jgi:hypothetical protein
MKPYLEIPCAITHNEGKNKEVPLGLIPDRIDYYYPGFHQGTVIVMASGCSMFTLLSSAELFSALQAYDEFTNANKGQFGNLQLTQKPKMHVAD